MHGWGTRDITYTKPYNHRLYCTLFLPYDMDAGSYHMTRGAQLCISELLNFQTNGTNNENAWLGHTCMNDEKRIVRSIGVADQLG